MIEVASLLRQLGSKEWEVARTLDWAGLTGRRQSTSNCPVANFVRLYFPNAFDVIVTTGEVCVWEEQAPVPALVSRIETPEPVSSFIASFDSGKYPRLDDRVDSVRGEWVRQSVETDLNVDPVALHPIPA